MRKSISLKYKFLLKQYSIVNEYLSDAAESEMTIYEAVIAFCVVLEKMIKIKMYKKNPVLVYDINTIKEFSPLTAVINKKDKIKETVKFGEALSRYSLIFEKDFSEDEIQAIKDVYAVRNEIIHGYRIDEDIVKDEEDVIKKMGGVWESFTKIVAKHFGEGSVKMKSPKKKYTKAELEQILKEEVRKKIENFYHDGYKRTRYDWAKITPLSIDGSNVCPRCGAYQLSNLSENNIMYPLSLDLYSGKRRSDIYKCSNCNLELTNKEYEIAQEIEREKYQKEQQY